MSIIILIGALYMLINGGVVQCLIYFAVVSTITNKYTDSNRRGGWWK